MENQAMTLAPPPAYQCYDCRGCGDCCKGRFAIRATREEYERIMAQGWEDDPELRGQTLFIPEGEQFRLAHRADGGCVFLNAQGLCRIHAKFGEPTKPLACRFYPFRLIPAGVQARVDVRFDCPAVAANHGAPITAQTEALRDFLPRVIPAGAETLPPPPLFERAALSWAHVERITRTFRQLLEAPSLDVTRRILACVTLSALLRDQRIVELERAKLDDFLRTVTAKVVQGIADDTLQRVPPSGSLGATFRQLLGLYARDDRAGEHTGLWARFSMGMRMLRGKGIIPPLRADLPAVPFAIAEEPMGLPPVDVAESVLRYYRLRLDSLGFCGAGFYGRSVLDGWEALLLTYPMIFWFARIYAHGAGLLSPDAACIQRAVTIVDHHHGTNPALNLPSERARYRALTDRRVLRGLVIWYGS